MRGPLVIALPSKGRLKEQAEAWLADCGLALQAAGGERGYAANLSGFEGVQVRLTSAQDIAAALAAGEVHLGVTGEDLLREAAPEMDRQIMLLLALGFGRADLVVAAPRSWIDVETMADVEEVAHDTLVSASRRLRVATKYRVQTRAFFASRGIADYRIVESGGATEGAPSAGLAELVVDITTSGATLAANGLRPLADGLILRSEARLAASLTAAWDKAMIARCSRLLAIFEARARARDLAKLSWPQDQDSAARRAASGRLRGPEGPGSGMVARAELFLVMDELSRQGVSPVSVVQPDYLFENESAAAQALATAVRRRTKRPF